MIERDLIKHIAAKAHRSHPNLLKGIGDDCAVFSQEADREWHISTDMLVQGVHFDTSWHQPYLLGRKSLAVNISDIAAMGAKPQFALLSVGLPGDLDSNWIESYVDGVLAILDEYQCVLVGGDTVSAKQLTISVTVLGTAPRGCSIPRDGAASGDSVYVSGNLGSSAAGLYLCQMRKASDPGLQELAWQQLVMAHLDPKPRVALAEILLQSGMVTSMQDISDGIATDLSHLCTASKVSAIIEEKSLPAHAELIEMCGQLNVSQQDFQLKGGEDYELVFTVRSGAEEMFENYCREQRRKAAEKGQPDIPVVTRIGVIQPGDGVCMRTHSGELIDIAYQGYEHSS
ncbi:thiamine-phosphate kinase [Desulfosediminicola ganghwensis]|uniref:thiamine-phosphate kinase n=1 Tax=Desulfosediminicola ganghwensis TaxID=2569540 RepID=UPI0010AC9FF4|nr:thiamine-phosphate kinase [Desulfosediminicola ganghwensis]